MNDREIEAAKSAIGLAFFGILRSLFVWVGVFIIANKLANAFVLWLGSH